MISDPAAYKKPAAGDPLVQTRVVSLTMDRFPGRFAAVIGNATVAEIIRDLHVDVPLDQALTTTIAPGVRVVVGPPKPPAGEAPRERFAIELDLPPEAQLQGAHKTVPWLKAIELVDSAGAPIGFDCKFELQRTSRGAVAKIQRDMIPYKTAAARIHLVLDVREHTVPFDFRNVPCIDP